MYKIKILQETNWKELEVWEQKDHLDPTASTALHMEGAALPAPALLKAADWISVTRGHGLWPQSQREGIPVTSLSSASEPTPDRPQLPELVTYVCISSCHIHLRYQTRTQQPLTCQKTSRGTSRKWSLLLCPAVSLGQMHTLGTGLN